MKSGARRRKTERRATPKWSEPGTDDRKKMNRIARAVKRLNRKGGPRHTLDHIVPLKSHLVCGLHTSANMQVITEWENLKKSNTWWPDGPFEQQTLALTETRIHQMRLAV